MSTPTAPTQPISPVHAVVTHTGSLSLNGVAHLLNPGGSGKTLYVWDCRVQRSPAVGENPNRARVTATPVTLRTDSGFTKTTAVAAHLDERDTTAIVGVFEAGDGPSPGGFDDLAGSWVQVASTYNDFEMDHISDFRDNFIELPEGWGLEVETGDQAGTTVRAYMLWDEVANP